MIIRRPMSAVAGADAEADGGAQARLLVADSAVMVAKTDQDATSKARVGTVGSRELRRRHGQYAYQPVLVEA